MDGHVAFPRCFSLEMKTSARSGVPRKRQQRLTRRQCEGLAMCSTRKVRACRRPRSLPSLPLVKQFLSEDGVAQGLLSEGSGKSSLKSNRHSKRGPRQSEPSEATAMMPCGFEIKPGRWMPRHASSAGVILAPAVSPVWVRGKFDRNTIRFWNITVVGRLRWSDVATCGIRQRSFAMKKLGLP